MKTASRKNPKKTMALWIIFSTLPHLLACLGSQSLGSTNQNGKATDPESIEDQGPTHPFTQTCLGGIVPGVTTREEVIVKLRHPSAIELEKVEQQLSCGMVVNWAVRSTLTLALLNEKLPHIIGEGITEL